jgi:hypothetical protein
MPKMREKERKPKKDRRLSHQSLSQFLVLRKSYRQTEMTVWIGELSYLKANS